MTDYEKTIQDYDNKGIKYMVVEGDFCYTMFIPLYKIHNGKAEVQLVHEFNKETGKILLSYTRTVA